MEGVDSSQAIREQLEEQRGALQEVEAALQHGDDAEMIQMQDELQAAVRELEAILGEAPAEAQPEQNGYNELPENAADEHTGLGFSLDDDLDEEEEWESEDEEAIGRASLAMSLDAVARAQAAAAGPQTETARFARWEEHTRGVGSKLMAAMGYMDGQGLGPSNSGAVAPIEVLMLRRGAGLGVAALEVRKASKRRRGGAKEQRRKATAAANAAREAARGEQNQAELQEGAPSLFAFMNTRLSDSAHSEDGRQASGQTYFNNESSQSSKKTHLPGHKSLVQHEDTCAELQRRMAKLRKIAACNAKDAPFLSQVNAKMAATQKELDKAQAASNRAHQAVHVRVKNDSWAKF